MANTMVGQFRPQVGPPAQQVMSSRYGVAQSSELVRTVDRMDSTNTKAITFDIYSDGEVIAKVNGYEVNIKSFPGKIDPQHIKEVATFLEEYSHFVVHAEDVLEVFGSGKGGLEPSLVGAFFLLPTALTAAEEVKNKGFECYECFKELRNRCDINTEEHFNEILKSVPNSQRRGLIRHSKCYGLWTCLSGKCVSFDRDRVTVTITPKEIDVDSNPVNDIELNNMTLFSYAFVAKRYLMALEFLKEGASTNLTVRTIDNNGKVLAPRGPGLVLEEIFVNVPVLMFFNLNYDGQDYNFRLTIKQVIKLAEERCSNKRVSRDQEGNFVDGKGNLLTEIKGSYYDTKARKFELDNGGNLIEVDDDDNSKKSRFDGLVIEQIKKDKKNSPFDEKILQKDGWILSSRGFLSFGGFANAHQRNLEPDKTIESLEWANGERAGRDISSVVLKCFFDCLSTELKEQIFDTDHGAMKGSKYFDKNMLSDKHLLKFFEIFYLFDSIGNHVALNGSNTRFKPGCCDTTSQYKAKKYLKQYYKMKHVLDHATRRDKCRHDCDVCYCGD